MINENIHIISFLGLPASGKGTQAQILANKIGACVIGIGELIRAEIESADFSDPFYADIKHKYDKGIPQSDEVVNDIVKKNLEKLGDKVIFDNFPFSASQADLFFKLCHDIGVSKPILVLVKIDRATALKRILSRKVCSACETVYIDDGNQICEKCGGALISRTDDNEETLSKRINEYLPRINEVLNAFKKSGLVIEIDGEVSIAKVSEQISKELSNANVVS